MSKVCNERLIRAICLAYSLRISAPYRNELFGAISYLDNSRRDYTRMIMQTHHSISIGRYTYGFNLGTFCRRGDVGQFCSIGPNAKIGHTNHPVDRVSTHSFVFDPSVGLSDLISRDYEIAPSGDFHVGNDVWIGTNAVVLPGIRIGNGAVIGAGSVTTKDVPPFAIMKGVPARVDRYRFSEDIIQKLQKIEWWNWSEGEIRKNSKQFNHPNDFTREFG